MLPLSWRAQVNHKVTDKSWKWIYWHGNAWRLNWYSSGFRLTHGPGVELELKQCHMLAAHSYRCSADLSSRTYALVYALDFNGVEWGPWKHKTVKCLQFQIEDPFFLSSVDSFESIIWFLTGSWEWVKACSGDNEASECGIWSHQLFHALRIWGVLWPRVS